MFKPIKLSPKSEESIAFVDWVIFAFLAILCFLSFQQGDIMHTGGSSFAYLNGHFLDFYDYNVQYFGGNSYMPSSYLLFAIWNIPIKLLGLMAVPTMSVTFPVVMWYKLLPTIFYLVSGYLIYKIALAAGMENLKAKLCGYAFLTMPIGFFSQFIFGQYDSFTVFFMLLGLLYYYRKDYLKFSIFFGISLTFKYFPLLIFIPMLLLVEKRVWHIIKYGIVVMIPIALEILTYLPSPAFKSGVFGFGATSYIFQVSLDTPFFSLSLFLLLWILLSAAAYFKDVSNADDLVKWSLFYSNIVTFLIFGLSMWHPQWLLFAVPFWVLGAFITKKFDTFMIIEFLMMSLFILFTVNFWIDHVDQNLFNLGIFGNLLAGRINQNLTIREIYQFQNRNAFFSLFSGVLLVYVLFKHPKFCAEKISEPITRFWGLVRFRFVAGLAVFLVPAFICFGVALNSPNIAETTTLFDAGTIFGGDVGELIKDREVSQIYSAVSTSVDRVDFFVNTFGRTNMSDLTLDLIDIQSQETLASIKIDASTLTDNAYNTIKFDSVETEVGKSYELKFSSDDAVNKNCISIYHTQSSAEYDSNYAVVDGFKTDYDLLLKIYSN